jgi:pSer/pThr/pTyr-binding forkhead associated (FHA) protein
VPPFVLTVLKLVFLALLYFFIYRAIRSVVVDLRPEERVQAGRERSPAKSKAKAKGGGKAPRSVVVVDERGSKLDSVRLDGTLQVGRADACQLRLSDTYASSFHARIYNSDGNWLIEDLGSTNGTYLNQRRITAPAEVRAGDKVRIGKTTLDFKR